MSVAPEIKAILVRVGELKVSIKKDTKELEDIKGQARDILLDLGANDRPVDIGTGVFTLRPRDKFEYSPELQALINQVDAQKKYEKSVGVAKLIETSYDVYFKEV